jgi:hypothetical protein
LQIDYPANRKRTKLEDKHPEPEGKNMKPSINPTRRMNESFQTNAAQRAYKQASKQAVPARSNLLERMLSRSPRRT